jgi:hypothetical protein
MKRDKWFLNSPSKWNMLKGLKNIYDWYLILTFLTSIFLKVHAHYRHELVFFWRFSRPRGGAHYTTLNMVQGLSEWLFFNANSEFCQLYHDENKLIFNEMIMRFVLYWINTHSWNFIVLTHWNNNPLIDSSRHSDTLSRFWANHYLPFLRLFLVFGLTWSGLNPTIYCSQGEHANHYTTDAVVKVHV